MEVFLVEYINTTLRAGIRCATVLEVTDFWQKYSEVHAMSLTRKQRVILISAAADLGHKYATSRAWSPNNRNAIVESSSPGTLKWD